MNILRAPDFRRGVSLMQRATLLSSATALISAGPNGQLLDLVPDATAWRHPWTTEARWNPEDERWEARVSVPGFVNGLEPTVATPNDPAVSLLEYPWLPMPFRTVGGDGDGIPAYFSALGAKAPATGGAAANDVGGVTITESLEDEVPRRTLAAGDLFLAQARPTYRSTVTVVDPTGASGLVVDYGVTYDTSTLDSVGSRCRLRVASQFPEVRKPTWMDRFMGTWQDEGEDRLQVSTLFLLSPENAEGEPDATWTPYVQHHLFWNLRYGAKNQIPKAPIQPIRITTGLLGGLGDAIGNQILAPINELTQKLDNALSMTTPEGRFWTHA